MHKPQWALFFLFIFFSIISYGQIVIYPLQNDPLRNVDSENVRNFRIAGTNYIDTLSLPFFDDFTSTNASIDSVYYMADGSISISTLGHHGLQNQEKIYLYFKETEGQYLNGNYFVKTIDKITFKLFKDQNLAESIQYSSIPNKRLHAYWKRPGAKIGPNADFTKWVDSGGVYINNTLAINPPSKYVASFDGLNAKGNPYSGGALRGPIDNLTSLPIDLSGLAAKDNVKLSFYWQVKGYGFLPTRKDSINLLFKDKTGVWNYVWGMRRKDNSLDTAKFYQEIISVTDTIYFYPGFQFRFQAFGNQGSAADNWNIDYIYFDKNWDNFKNRPRDRAISKSQSSLLKNYHSMPYEQFKDSRENELADTINLSLTNLSGTEIIINFDQKYITDGVKKVDVKFTDFNQLIGQSIEPKKYQYTFAKSSIDFTGDFLTLKSIVSVQSSDPDRITGIDFTSNNTDSTTTIISDYYAYDDGSAEKTGGNIAGGPMIVKYILNSVPDTITAIDINFSKAYTFNSPAYSQVDVIIADSKKDIKETIKAFKPTYPSGINNFSRAVPTKGYYIVTEKEFYVGYLNPYPSDINNVNIPIGMDWTNPQKGEVFYKNLGSTTWNKYTGGGNFMIRPVFGKLPITGLTNKNNTILNCSLFPNPTSGILTIEGLCDYIEIFDIAGKSVFKKNFVKGLNMNHVDLTNLCNGVYLMHLENDQSSANKKIFLSK